MMHEMGLSSEERVSSLFQPDTLLPAQYLDTYRRKAHLEPEKRLMLAVLEDAIACFQKYIFAQDNKGKTMFQEVEEWILEEDNQWLFSFQNICEVLGFNPGYIRQGLIDWKKRQLAERPRAKVYCLTLEGKKKKTGMAMSRGTGHKGLKAAGR